MAKGDMGGGAKSASGVGPPKQDQYSVMHSIMDTLGGNGGSIAPSVMPRSPDQGQMGVTPNSNQFGGDVPQINYPNNPNVGGGRFGAMFGVNGGAPSIAPQNPQDMMRRTMMGKGVYGQ